VDLIGRHVVKWVVTKEVGDDVLGSGKIDHFGTIVLLNNQPPVADTISVEIRKGKVLVVSVDPNDVS
jgi:hypothetical protein